MIFHQNRSKIFLKHFFEILSLKFFIPEEISRLRMLSRPGKGRNLFGEWLFGIPVSQKWKICLIFPHFSWVFPGTFRRFSSRILQKIRRFGTSGSRRYQNYHQAPRNSDFRDRERSQIKMKFRIGIGQFAAPNCPIPDTSKIGKFRNWLGLRFLL